MKIIDRAQAPSSAGEGEVAWRKPAVAAVLHTAVARDPVPRLCLDHARGLLRETIRAPRLGQGGGLGLFGPPALFGVRERGQRERERSGERNGQGFHRKLPSEGAFRTVTRWPSTAPAR